MRRMGVLLVVLVAGAIAGETFGASAPPGAGRVPPPGGILVTTNRSHCYPPNSRVKITARDLTPGTSATASGEETVERSARASSTGVATIVISAPSAVSRGRVEAVLVGVVGSDAAGSIVGSDTAFVLGTKAACSALNRR